jgi:hypothetical protein
MGKSKKRVCKCGHSYKNHFNTETRPCAILKKPIMTAWPVEEDFCNCREYVPIPKKRKTKRGGGR